MAIQPARAGNRFVGLTCGIKVLLLPVWPAGEATGLRRLVWSDTVNGAVVEVNRELAKLAKDAKDIRVIDLFARATEDLSPHARGELYLDTLHFRSQAYIRLTPILEKSLESWLRESDQKF